MNIKIIDCKFPITNEKNKIKAIYNVRGQVGKIIKKDIIDCRKNCNNCNDESCEFYQLYIKKIPKPYTINLYDNKATITVFGEGDLQKIFSAAFNLILSKKNINICEYYSTLDATLNNSNSNSNSINSLDINNVNIHFITPVNIIENGEFVSFITPEILYNAIVRRIKMLNDFYQTLIDIPNIPKEVFNKIKINKYEMLFEHNQRKSQRQNVMMPLDGIKGTISWNISNLTSEEIEAVVKILNIGRLIKIGKNTAFGMGDYNIG